MFPSINIHWIVTLTLFTLGWHLCLSVSFPLNFKWDLVGMEGSQGSSVWHCGCVAHVWSSTCFSHNEWYTALFHMFQCSWYVNRCIW
jgi:hypothetical protein